MTASSPPTDWKTSWGIASLPLFRQRKELLLFLLPVAALLVGITAASSGELQVRCSLHPWR